MWGLLIRRAGMNSGPFFFSDRVRGYQRIVPVLNQRIYKDFLEVHHLKLWPQRGANIFLRFCDFCHIAVC